MEGGKDDTPWSDPHRPDNFRLVEVVDCEVCQLDSGTGRVVFTHEAFPSREDVKSLEDMDSSSSDHDD